MRTQFKTDLVIELFLTKDFSLHIFNEWKKYDKCISFGLGFIRFEITDLNNNNKSSDYYQLEISS